MPGLPLRRCLVAITTAVLLLLGLVACAGGDDRETSPSELRPRLEHARQVLDDANSLSFTLSTSDLPTDVTGLVQAEGTGTHDPAFKGTVKVSTGGTTMDADVIAVKGTVYAKLGFSPKYVPIDPTSVGAPDPATLMSTDDGVSALLTATEQLTAGDQSRSGSKVLSSIDGVVPGDAVQQVIPSADADAEFSARWRLSDDDVLHDARLTGPFYPGGDSVTYTIELTASDATVDIKAP